MGRNEKEPESQISFESWKLELRKDCEREDRIMAFNLLGDSVLRILFEQGLDPSIKGIVDGTPQVSAKAYQEQRD